MAGQDQNERVWDIIEHIGVGMLTTRFAGGFRARPLEARADREAGIIWFLTDSGSAKDHEIGVEPDVGLVFIDPGNKAYLSITARAQIRRDIPQARKIWKTTDKMWWDGPEDPNLRVLRVDPQTAELWDGPSNVAVTAYEFVKARITGEKPNLGENRKVTVKL
jgi:general stress protein 26